MRDAISTIREISQSQNGKIIMAPLPEEPVINASDLLPETIPEQESETLYIQNLNEKIKISGTPCSAILVSLLLLSAVMKSTLRGLFKTYGDVLDVVAHGNVRMRGQAFVSFTSSDIAKKAQKEVNRFPLYSKPMVCYHYFLYNFVYSFH